MTIQRRCATCGSTIYPHRGQTVHSASFARRVCCSRKCALKMPPNPETVAARNALQAELAKRVTAAIASAGVLATRAWLRELRESIRCVKRASASACLIRLRELQRAASGEGVE